ncbi:MAG: hypothetical protein FGM21_08500 [Limnohabitans sp.]|nr:hypothetical protein [Limnohabitans sp.]
MKYLILLLVVLAAVWWLRRPSRGHGAKTEKHPTAKGPQEMIQCQHCGVHLPRQDAVTGAQGLYCGEAHKQQQEG